MKKILAVLALGYASTTLAAVAGSAHDLTAHNINQVGQYGTAAASTTACQFCHTPHGANSAADFATAPLWNRSFQTATAPVFTMYNQAGVTGTVDAAPNAASLTCLTCHEGSATLGLTFSSGNLLTGGQNTTIATATGRNLIVGRDLTNDHPVSIPYPPAGTTGFVAGTNTGVGGLPLYISGGTVGKVECGTCHDPHRTTDGKFLRAPASGLCQTCHSGK